MASLAVSQTVICPLFSLGSLKTYLRYPLGHPGKLFSTNGKTCISLASTGILRLVPAPSGTNNNEHHKKEPNFFTPENHKSSNFTWYFNRKMVDVP